MSEIFVIGSAGFIGSIATNYFIQTTPHRIASMDYLKHNNLDRVMPAMESRRHSFYLMDLAHKEITAKAFEIEKPSTIVYTAFNTSLSPVANMANIESVLQQAKPSKVIFTASISDDPSFWQLMEQVLVDVIKSIPWMSIIKWAFLKVENLFGPRQSFSANQDHALTSLLDQALWRQNKIVGSDTAFDWVYIQDYCSEISRFSQTDFNSGVYSIKTNNCATVKNVGEFLNALIFDQNRTTIVREESAVSDQDIVIVPNKSLEEAIEHTTSWYAVNRWIHD